MKRNKKDGYFCKCGAFHKFTAWVYAHLNIEIRHKCDCGRVNILLNKGVIRTLEITAPKGYDRK